MEKIFNSNYGDGEEQLLYIDLSDFADHLVDLYKRNELNEFEQIFDLIERLHVNGDDYVKKASTIGLLEDIQNIASSRNVKPEVFLRFLKPISTKWWNNINDFFSGKTRYVGGPNKE